MALTIATGVTGCPAIARSLSPAPLTDTFWRLETLGGDTVDIGASIREPFILFRGTDAAGMSASVGCNRMAGRFTRDGTTLQFGAIAMTRMMCPPPLDRLERALADVLTATTGFDLAGQQLILTDASGEDLATFSAVYRP